MNGLGPYIGNEELFPILRHWTFFNHAGVSPIPKIGRRCVAQICPGVD
jgi:hypothetical protein